MKVKEKTEVRYWDCHSHLSFLSEEEAIELIESTPNDQGWVLGGYQPNEWECQVSLKNKFPHRIKTCYGLHPWYVKSDEFDLSRDSEDLKIWSDQADFIGEVGLDFFGDESILKKDTQIHVFEKQLELAMGKPFVLHVVQAHGKALEILKDHPVKGFVHSFSGSIEVAERYLQEGLLLSFGTNLLNENFKKARETFKELPIEKILIESDTPSHALDTESPLRNLQLVYKEAAKIRGMDLEGFREQIATNFSSFLS